MLPSEGEEAVRTNHAEALPKTLPGAVCLQWVRCGRRNCRCARRRLHGPYFYRFWREGGRLRKAYVRPADLGQVVLQCRQHRLLRRELAAWWDRWREMAAVVREAERR